MLTSVQALLMYNKCALTWDLEVVIRKWRLILDVQICVDTDCLIQMHITLVRKAFTGSLTMDNHLAMKGVFISIWFGNECQSLTKCI